MRRSMRWAFVSPKDFDPAALITMRDINPDSAGPGPLCLNSKSTGPVQRPVSF